MSRPEGSVPRDPPTAAPVPPCGLESLWAVRHGQSTANVAFAAAAAAGSTAPLAGRDRDVALSPLGVRQAEALGRRLAALDAEGGPDLVVCSPYLRARRTWQVMRRTAAAQGGPRPPASSACPTPRVPPARRTVVDERLRDREMGVFELHPPSVVRARSPEEAARRALSGEWHYRPPGGEALTDVALRVGQFLSDLCRAAPGRRVLLVAHDSVLVALRHVLAGTGAVPSEELPPVPNASLSHWESDGRALRLRTWGDTAHLPPPGPAD
ncbi:histidine phosphatase family protein [Streptomyces sp. NPDC088785]|uniref:histidine phosphatase family protein n=1 Tax=Streptomyces sp. NPDC088785 TaxID=3365897 RepID=UPI00381F3BF5